jgi:hypothetical protein
MLELQQVVRGIPEHERLVPFGPPVEAAEGVGDEQQAVLRRPG